MDKFLALLLLGLGALFTFVILPVGIVLGWSALIFWCLFWAINTLYGSTLVVFTWQTWLAGAVVLFILKRIFSRK